MDKTEIEKIALEVCEGIPLEMKTHLPNYSVRFAERFLSRIDAERGNACVCGEPMTLGVVHRTDGPCFLSPTPVPDGMALVPIGDTQDAISNAMRRAWQLGQTYWQQADSDSWSQNAKSDDTNRKFVDLCEETRALIAAAQGERNAD